MTVRQSSVFMFWQVLMMMPGRAVCLAGRWGPGVPRRLARAAMASSSRVRRREWWQLKRE